MELQQMKVICNDDNTNMEINQRFSRKGIDI